MKYPKKGKQKSNRKTLIRYCLKTWADIVKVGGKCELCGVTHLQLHAHHIVKRGWAFCMGWFLELNGICLCYKCHQKVHSTNFNEQVIYHNKIIEWLKEKGVDYEVLHLKCKSRKNIDLSLIKIALKAVLKEKKKGVEI